MATRTTEELAAEIRTALSTQNPYGAIGAICLLLADNFRSDRGGVVTENQTPLEGYLHWASEWFPMGQAMADFKMGGDVTVDGDKITTVYKLTGTRRSGPKVEANLKAVHTVADGYIVETVAIGDEGHEGVESLRGALMDAGITISPA